MKRLFIENASARSWYAAWLMLKLRDWRRPGFWHRLDGWAAEIGPFRFYRQERRV